MQKKKRGNCFFRKIFHQILQGRVIIRRRHYLLLSGINKNVHLKRFSRMSKFSIFLFGLGGPGENPKPQIKFLQQRPIFEGSLKIKKFLQILKKSGYKR